MNAIEERQINKLRNINISKRIRKGYTAVILVMIFIVGIGISSLINCNNNFKSFINGAYTASVAISDSRIETNIAARTIREMAIVTDTGTYSSYAAKIEENEAAILENIKVLKESFANDAPLVDNYEKAVKDWIAIGNSIVAEIENGNIEEARVMIIEQCAPALQNLIELAKELNNEIVQMEEKGIKLNENVMVWSIMILVVLLMIGVLFSYVLAKRISTSISVPLNAIMEASEEMSKGNLNSKLEIYGDDEVARVGNSLKKSMNILYGYVMDIDRCMNEMSKGNFDISASKKFIGDFKNIEVSIIEFSKKMSDVLGTINKSSDQVAISSEQIAAGAEALTEGAAEQADAIQQLKDMILSVSNEVDKNAKNSKEANEMTHEVGQYIEGSNTQMNSMVSSMKEISRTSNEINNIIDTINDIASQTNLLALNASIEAARAGEAGRGFAVVADQVSKLASESAKAAKNSTELIKISLGAVENGMNIVDTTAEGLIKSVEKTRELVDNIGQISEASGRQAKELEGITDEVNQVSAVIQENNAMAEESAASSEEMSRQAELLKELAGQFNLKK